MENLADKLFDEQMTPSTRPDIGDTFKDDDTGVIYEVVKVDDKRTTFAPAPTRHNEITFNNDHIADYFTAE